jgi:hypothetical protein
VELGSNRYGSRPNMGGFFRALGPGLVSVAASVAALSCEATSERHAVSPPRLARAGSVTTLECLGGPMPMRAVRGVPYLDVTLLGPARAHHGTFLVDYGTNYSTLDVAKVGSCRSAGGERCPFPELSFAGVSARNVALTKAHHPSPSQTGILGTDLTRSVALTLDYGRAVVRAARAAEFCGEGYLRAAGLTPLSTTGFFASDGAALRPLGDVVAGAPARKSVANVPAVPLRIAGVSARAQLDTGFDAALVPWSVNVNVALFDAIVAANPGLLVRTPARDLTLTTCTGGTEPALAYTLAGGTTVDFVGEEDQSVRSFADATLFVKHTPEAARACGGIGAWTVPAAQVAASFFEAFGVIVFDPFGSRVWVS